MATNKALECHGPWKTATLGIPRTRPTVSLRSVGGLTGFGYCPQARAGNVRYTVAVMVAGTIFPTPTLYCFSLNIALIDEIPDNSVGENALVPLHTISLPIETIEKPSSPHHHLISGFFSASVVPNPIRRCTVPCSGTILTRHWQATQPSVTWITCTYLLR